MKPSEVKAGMIVRHVSGGKPGRIAMRNNSVLIGETGDGRHEKWSEPTMRFVIDQIGEIRVDYAKEGGLRDAGCFFAKPEDVELDLTPTAANAAGAMPC